MKTENPSSQLKCRIKIPRDGAWLFKPKQTLFSFWKLKGLAKLVFIYVKTNLASPVSFQLTKQFFQADTINLKLGTIIIFLYFVYPNTRGILFLPFVFQLLLHYIYKYIPQYYKWIIWPHQYHMLRIQHAKSSRKCNLYLKKKQFGEKI